MPETQLTKLNAKRVDALKGKLLEVRRVGAKPIFVEAKVRDSVMSVLENADVPVNDSEIKIEGMLENSNEWAVLKGNEKAQRYARLVITTKVEGA